MKEALIVLSLLGCDDTGLQCEYIRTAEASFADLETCRAASSEYLASADDAAYPTVVAMCSPAAQTAEGPMPPEPPREQAAQTSPTDMRDEGFLSRVGSAVASVLPERETVEKPVEKVADGAMRVGEAVIVGVRRAAGAVNPF